MKILVLGGHGFIGQRLVDVLTEMRYEVFSASRSNNVDLIDYVSTIECFNKTSPDAIINCAAHVGSVHYVSNHAADIVSDNMQMALNLYKAAAKSCPTAKIINPLSNCSYPGNSEIQREQDWWAGEVHESVFSYGNTRRFIYVISRCYEKQYGIRSINFLIPNTFGPGDSIDENKTHALNGMIIRMIKAERQGDKKFEIWGTGRPIREWAYVEDVINILIEGIQTKENLVYPVNLAQKKGYTIKESAEIIADSLGFMGKLVFNTQYRDGAPVKILEDERFRKLFPNFKFYDHKKGIDNTVEYYKSVL